MFNSSLYNLDWKESKEEENFTYLCNIGDQQGGTEADIKAIIRKAKKEFLHLENIWKAKGITTHIKVGLFSSNVKAVLLIGSETWRMILYNIQDRDIYQLMSEMYHLDQIAWQNQ